MKLNDYRNKIDQIDEQMKQLFIERMMIVKKISVLKKEENIPILDQKREEEMFAKHKINFPDLTIWPYYESFLKNIIRLSKEVQK